jgi:hypothetical protein
MCTDKDSQKDPHCQKVSLCVEEIQRICGFRTSCEGQKYIEERATRTCEEGDKKHVCGAPTKCVTKKRWIYDKEEKKGALDVPDTKLPVRLALIPLFGLAVLFAVRRGRRR